MSDPYSVSLPIRSLLPDAVVLRCCCANLFSFGDLCQQDMGTGLPFRPATFDGCISVSALQVTLVARFYLPPCVRVDPFNFSSIHYYMRTTVPTPYERHVSRKQRCEYIHTRHSSVANCAVRRRP